MTKFQHDDHLSSPLSLSLRLFPNRLHLPLHDHQPLPPPARAAPAAAAAARGGEEAGEAAEAERRQPGSPLLQPAARLLLQLRSRHLGEGGRDQRG